MMFKRKALKPRRNLATILFFVTCVALPLVTGGLAVLAGPDLGSAGFHDEDQFPADTLRICSMSPSLDGWLLDLIDEVAPDYYNYDWDISLSQFKAWLATIAWSEGEGGGYGTHSQGAPGNDVFNHIAVGNSFRFSTGIGPFQLDRNQTENWSSWITGDKLDPRKSVASTARWHSENRFGGSTLSSFSNLSPWVAVRPAKIANRWFEVTNTLWSSHSGGKPVNPNDDIDWPAVKNRLAYNALNHPHLSYSNNVVDKGIMRWNITAKENLTTDSGRPVVFDDFFPTLYVIARGAGSGQEVCRYYYTYRNDGPFPIEVWLWDNSSDPVNKFRYIFARECNGEFPEGRLGDKAGYSALSQAAIGELSQPPEVGSLKVTIRPNEAAVAGARWRLTSGPDTGWKNSGDYIHDLPAGVTYTISFKTVDGWISPSNINVTILANASWIKEGVYQLKQEDCHVTIPNSPSGPGSGAQGNSYTYSTGGSSCAGGHDLQYRFDWGDGTYSSWTSSTVASKIWTDTGIYQVRSQARCAVNTSVVSVWSAAKSVSIDSIAELPDVQTFIATNITENSATIWGMIVDEGSSAIVDRRFDWGTSLPLANAVYSDSIQVSGNYFCATLTNLSPNTTYHFRAWAKNGSGASQSELPPGWSHGEIETFTTSSPASCSVTTPNQPSGPVGGSPNSSYSFTASGSSCSKGHSVQYRFDWGDGTCSSWSSSSTASKMWADTGTYYVRAQARCASNTAAVSSWSTSKIVTIAQPVGCPDVRTMITVFNITGSSAQIWGNITNDGGSPIVDRRFDWGTSTPLTEAVYSNSIVVTGSYFYTTLTNLSPNTTYYYRAWAKNSAGWSQGLIQSFTTSPEGSACTVSCPGKPYGPVSGSPNSSYSFNTGNSSCASGHDVQYRFDWGDGTYSSWGLSAGANKIWSSAGVYQVRAQARCAINTAVTSGWSPAHEVTIATTCSVLTPLKPTGPSSGYSNSSYSYNSGGAHCAGGHDVQYRFDWGDGTYSSWLSNASDSKVWSSPGTYQVRVQARCSSNTHVTSGWSTGLAVSITLPPCVVNTPNTPYGGANTGFIRETYHFFTTGSRVCSNSHIAEYQFAWGDGTYSDWVVYSEYVDGAFASKVWFSPGTYSVRVRARCSETHIYSNWSAPREIIIYDPEVCSVSTPEIPTGPGTYFSGTDVTFYTGSSFCTGEHGVEYRFDWGNEGYSPWSAKAHATYRWSSSGTYQVRAQARCAVNHAAISAWSLPRTVVISAQPAVTQPLGNLQIGDRVVDNSWVWEHRTGNRYTGEGETGPVTWIVVSRDHYNVQGSSAHITLLCEGMIANYPFDTSDNRFKSHWGNSGTYNAEHGLRPFLNSLSKSQYAYAGNGFYSVFSTNFKNNVLTTYLPNKEWDTGYSYTTQDKVFVLSLTELGGEAEYAYTIGTVLPYFSEDARNRRKATWSGINNYWTRTPNILTSSSYLGDSMVFINSSGDFEPRFWAGGSGVSVRPALNIKAELPVSAVPNADGAYEINWDPVSTWYNVTINADLSLGSISGEGAYPHGNYVTVRAEPNPGCYFIGWTENGSVVSTETVYTFSAEASRNLVANFAEYDLYYSAGPGGSINGEACQIVEYGGDGLPVTAVPDSGFHFIRWNDGLVDNPRQDKNVTRRIAVKAEFAQTPTWTLTVEEPFGEGATVPGSGDYLVEVDRSITVTAQTVWGWRFSHWLLDGERAGSDMSITVWSDLDCVDRTLRPVFYLVAAADQPVNWHWRNILPQSNTLEDIVYGNNKFVAVGESGTILTSYDGVQWVEQDSGVTGTLKSITYGDNRFVAVGSNTTILTSFDGVNWTPTHKDLQQALGIFIHLEGVAYGNNKFVAVGSDAGKTLVSTDGFNWATTDIGEYYLMDVAYGNNVFVAAGRYGTILTSPDGVSWVDRSLSIRDELMGVTYGNSLFVVVGSSGAIYTSTDGVNWMERNSGSSEWLFSAACLNNTFFAVGASGTVVTSSNGVDWLKQDSATTRFLNGISYGNGVFVIVASSGEILISADGESWGMVGTTRHLRGIVYANGKFVVVGAGGTIMTSNDGAIWLHQDSGTAQQLNSVTYGSSKFVLTGNEGAILTSSDGACWTTRASGTTYTLNAVTYANNVFVAVGDSGIIITSTDGVTWSQQESGIAERLRDIVYGNNTFVVVGGSGTILTSKDGVSWNNQTSGTTWELDSVTHGNGLFAATGIYGEILTSADGVNWTPSSPKGTLLGINHGNSTFIAVGFSGKILTSINGLDWIEQDSGTTNHLYNVVYGNNTFVAIGDYGALIQSDPVSAGQICNLVATANPPGGGTITRFPERDVCYPGELVVLTAVPADGYEFSGWSGDVSGENCEIYVIMDQEKTVSANFTPTEKYSLTVISEHGNPDLPVGEHFFMGGAELTLAVVSPVNRTDGSQYICTGWIGTGDVPATGSSHTVTLNLAQDSTITWLWKRQVALTATMAPDSVGSVEGVGWYDLGHAATIYAHANPGFTFREWSGAIVSTDNPVTVEMNEPKHLTAHFDRTYAIVVTAVPCDGGVVEGTGIYNHGTLVTVTATPSAGYYFVNWTEDNIEVSSDSSFTFTAKGNYSLEANFAQLGGIPGDIDGNGVINVCDAVLVLRHIVGLVDIGQTYGPEALVRARVSGSNGPDVGDAILILRHIVGLITEFPMDRQ